MPSKLRSVLTAAFTITALLLGLVECVAAQDKAVAPAAAEYRQFDFWLGDWVVRGPAGKIVSFPRTRESRASTLGRRVHGDDRR